MILTIHDYATSSLIAERTIDGDKLDVQRPMSERPSGRRRVGKKDRPPGAVRLGPRRDYWLRLYRCRDEPTEAPGWSPVPREDVLIHWLARSTRDEAWEPQPPAGAEELVLRLHFHVDNDRPLTKRVRWAFERETSGVERRTWRLPLEVSPSVWTRCLLGFYIMAGVFLSDLVDSLASGWSPSWIGRAALLAFVFAIGISMVTALYDYLRLRTPS